MRVQDALRIAGRPAREAQPGRRPVVDLRVVEAGLLALEQLLVADRVRELGEVALAHHDVVLDGLELVDVLGERVDERAVDEDHLVLRVVDHVDELLGEQPDVQGVQHGPHARRREVGLEVVLAVPGERRHPVAVAHPELAQPAAQPVDALAHLGVGRARRPVVRERHDLGVAVHAPHPLQDELERQRMVVLHQPFEHRSS